MIKECTISLINHHKMADTNIPKILHFQALRGDANVATQYKGRSGEFFFDLTNRHVRIHDGLQVGGYLIANFSDIPTKVSQLVNDAQYSTGTADGKANSAIHDQNGNVINEHYSPINSPHFVGIPTCPTPDYNDQSSQQIVNAQWAANCSYIVRTYGNQTINGTKTFTSDINGTAIRAKWADLAENYYSDANYPIGTLIAFGGENEITIATDSVNGVISENPAMLLNTNISGNNVLPVALAGRVKIRVLGSVKKFDKIVLSKTPGIGKVDNRAKGNNVIGRALEDSDDGLVLCVTKFNLE